MLFFPTLSCAVTSRLPVSVIRREKRTFATIVAGMLPDKLAVTLFVAKNTQGFAGRDFVPCFKLIPVLVLTHCFY